MKFATGHGTSPSSSSSFHHNYNYNHHHPHPIEVSKRPPGPRMPDGTRGFTMGRGKPLAPPPLPLTSAQTNHQVWSVSRLSWIIVWFWFRFKKRRKEVKYVCSYMRSEMLCGIWVSFWHLQVLWILLTLVFLAFVLLFIDKFLLNGNINLFGDSFISVFSTWPSFSLFSWYAYMLKGYNFTLWTTWLTRRFKINRR